MVEISRNVEESKLFNKDSLNREVFHRAISQHAGFGSLLDLQQLSDLAILHIGYISMPQMSVRNLHTVPNTFDRYILDTSFCLSSPCSQKQIALLMK